MDILLSGSVAFDYLMTFPGYFRDHILPERIQSLSLSFLVDSMTRLRGGVAPNIAYTLALLGKRPRLWATVGEDFEEYRLWLEGVGVDTRGAKIVPGDYTASFFVNTDQSNAQIASFYPGAMAQAGHLSLRELDGDYPDLVVVSPNDPLAMQRNVQECIELCIPYVYDPSQQIVRLSAGDINTGIHGALALFVNDYEAALVEKITGMGPDDILANCKCSERGTLRLPPFVVVTRGEQGADIYTENGNFHVPVVPPGEIVDPTGVGDAFRGGFLTGYSNGFDWEICGQMGSLAATYCLEQRGTQGHHYTPAEFVERFRQHFDDRGELDRL